MASKHIPTLDKKKFCPTGTPEQTPNAGQHLPDANVGDQGQCVLAPHPESVRLDTGEPCVDGRDGGKP